MKNYGPILAAATISRLLLNSLRRIPYAIMSDLAAALGVPRQTVELSLSLQWAAGLLSPLFASAIDHTGRKRLMLIALAVFTILAGSGAIASLVGMAAGVVLALIVLSEASKVLYDPAMTAYISEYTPIHRRGFAVGVTELAWSGSLVIFAPIAAYIIGLNSSLPRVALLLALITACGAVGFVLIWRIMPDDSARRVVSAEKPRPNWNLLFSNRSALMLLVATAGLSMAGEIIGVGYEAWFKSSFNLAVGELGTLALFISGAELIGEFAVVFFADRIGRRNMTLIAMFGCAIFSVLLPLMGNSVAGAIAMLVGVFVGFESGIVAVISLATDVLPSARGTMMTSLIAALAGSRAIATLLGGAILRSGGYLVSGITAFTLLTLATIILWRFVPEIRHTAIIQSAGSSE
ncbi:MAG: MFS transporter [Anaerolineae bacterium]|nr:MFS transporter [Anaerolineae bacterium]